MKLKDNIGPIMLFRVDEDFRKEAQEILQISTHSFFAQLVDTDEMGIWVENINWRIYAPRENAPSYFKIHALIPWDKLISVGMFPDSAFPGIEAIKNTKGVSEIGFGRGRPSSTNCVIS